jgi:hypothetical protein
MCSITMYISCILPFWIRTASTQLCYTIDEYPHCDLHWHVYRADSSRGSRKMTIRRYCGVLRSSNWTCCSSVTYFKLLFHVTYEAEKAGGRSHCRQRFVSDYFPERLQA